MKKTVPIYHADMFDFIKYKTFPAHELSFLKRLWIKLFGVKSIGTDTDGVNVTIITSYVYKGKIYIFNYKWSD